MASSQSEDTTLPGEGETSVAVSLRVLSPSFEPNHRLSLDDLPLVTTVLDLKHRITALIPSRPTPDQQRLIYRGRPLLNPNAALQDFLEPPLDTTHTLHLVLPPGPESSSHVYATPDSALRYRNTSHQDSNLNRSSSPFSSTVAPDLTRTHAPVATGAQLQGRGAVNIPSLEPNRPPQASHQLGVGQQPRDWHEALEQTRRQAEGLTQAVERARTIINTHTVRMRIQNLNVPRSDNVDPSSQQSPSDRPGSGSTVNVPAMTTRQANIAQSLNNGVTQSLLLARIATQLIGLEMEVQRGTAPSIDSIARVRVQLYAMLDARYRQPSLAISSEAEGFLLRLQNVYTRAYQIRQLEHLRQFPSAVNHAAGTIQTGQTSDYYLVTSPSGEQMILAPPGLSQPQFNHQSIPAFPTATQPAANDPAAVALAANGAMQNAVRQAVLNGGHGDRGRARGRGNDNGNDQFAQNVRRFWLFIRLYFFCFLFTDSGTWERFLFVGAAAFIAFFTETTFMRRIFEMVVQPIQRHLEGLIHDQPPVPSQPQQGGNTNTTNNNDNLPDQRPAANTGGFRRIERACALFLASLIPGVGERQVEVRNAAEEAARNAQEQQAREDAERAQNNTLDNETSPAAAATAESSSSNNQGNQNE